MRSFRETTIIPKNSVERIIPIDIIHNGYFKEMGVLHCGISILRGGARIDRNKNRDYHILIISIKGSGRFLMESGESFDLLEGRYFFSDANGQGHRHVPLTNEWELVWFQIKREADWLYRSHSDYHIEFCQVWQEIYRCLISIIQEDIFRQEGFVEMENLQIQLLFHYLKRTLSTGEYKGSQLRYLNKFNTLWNEISLSIDKKWNIDEICSFLHLSKAQASRICKQMFQMSLAEKVKDIKLRHAFSLLSNFNLTVSMVAEMIGYESISSFSVAFKNKFGCSPKNITKGNCLSEDM